MTSRGTVMVKGGVVAGVVWVEVGMVVGVGLFTAVRAGAGIGVAADVGGESGIASDGVETSPHPASMYTPTNTLTMSHGHMAQFYQT